MNLTTLGETMASRTG